MSHFDTLAEESAYEYGREIGAAGLQQTVDECARVAHENVMLRKMVVELMKMIDRLEEAQ